MTKKQETQEQVLDELEQEIIDAVADAGYRCNPRGQRSRALRLLAARESHPTAEVEVCRDEYTGLRYGAAACRVGRCVKLGHNSTTRGGDGSNCYQVWAVW